MSAVHPRRSWRGGIGARFWRRRMRAEWVLVVALVISVLAATAVLAAMPLVFERASELDVRQTITTAQPEQRNIALRLEARLAPGGDDPLARVAEMGDVYERNSMPESVSPIVSERLFVVDSPTFRATSYPEGREGPFPTTFRFRLQDDIETESQLVEGALPRPHDPIIELIGPECPSEGYDIAEFTPSDEIDCDLVATPVLETAITRETAADVGVEVGDLMTLTPNLSEIPWQLADAGDLRIALMVSGIVELSDLSRDYWYADNRLHAPRITENADFRWIAATGLLSPEQYRQLFTDIRRINFEYTWRLLVDPERIDLRTASQIAVDLANVDGGAVEVMTGLPGLVGEYEEQRAVVLVLLSTAAFGLALVVASVVASLVMLMSMRQVHTTSLLMARGASRRHLLIDAARTAMALVGPAAAAGWLIAWFTFRSRSSSASIGVVAAFASLAVVTIVAAIMPRAVVAERALRRVAVEVAVVAATAGAVLAVRRRGAITGEGIAEFDILLAMTPALVIVSAALITVRLVGPLARTVSWVAERGRGLTIFVGLRRLVARPVASRTAAAAMLVAVGIAVFSASLHSAISRGREASSWYEVGADFTIQGESMGSPLPPAVESVALDLNLVTAQRTTSAGATVRRGRDSWAIDIVAIDAASYARMLDGAPFRPPPFELLTGTGSRADAAAFVSSRWPTGPSPNLDEVLTLDVGSGRLDVTVVAQLDAFPAIAPNRPFVVVDLATIAGGGAEYRPTALHISGEAGLGGQLADRLAADAPHTRLISRRDTLERITTDPFSSWTVRSLGIVFVLSALFAAVAGSAALGISVVARASEAAVLRTLGVDVRQDGLITAIEHAPAVALATVGGAAAGTTASWLLRPALGLSRFAGQRRLVDASLEIRAILETAGLLAVTMSVAVAVSMYVRRTSDVAATLRVGEMP
jgi:putative ABC transport system permease protein